MVNTKPFDTRRYIQAQSKVLKDSVRKEHDVLYIEFGGKILQDRHSARVLPGYHEDTKLKLLKKLVDPSCAIFVVSSRDILRKRIRGDFKIPYDEEAIRTLTELKKRGFPVKHVAISMLSSRKRVPKAIQDFEEKLKMLGCQSYRFQQIANYTPKAFTPNTLAANPYIPVLGKVVAILSPGGGSGKFGVCLNQLYHEMLQGRSPRYQKFETFPLHDRPLNHPLNLAYMAASADFYDQVKRDIRHGTATSYNRDLDNYELLRRIAREFKENGSYLRELNSATQMGANMLSAGIVDEDAVCREAAAEIARRLVRYEYEVKEGKEQKSVVERTRRILRYL